MYELIRRYEQRYIRKYCKMNNVPPPNSEDIYDLASDMAVWFMARYKDPAFKAESMSAYGHFAFLKIFMDPNRIARDQRERTIRELEKTEQDNEYFIEDDTEEDKRLRAHTERVSAGVVQYCLDFGEAL